METFKASHDLDDNLPDVLFLHPVLCFVTLADSLKDVPIVSEFHHDTTPFVSLEVGLTIGCLTLHQKRLPCTRQHRGS